MCFRCERRQSAAPRSAPTWSGLGAGLYTARACGSSSERTPSMKRSTARDDSSRKRSRIASVPALESDSLLERPDRLLDRLPLREQHRPWVDAVPLGEHELEQQQRAAVANVLDRLGEPEPPTASWPAAVARKIVRFGPRAPGSLPAGHDQLARPRGSRASGRRAAASATRSSRAPRSATAARPMPSRAQAARTAARGRPTRPGRGRDRSPFARYGRSGSCGFPGLATTSDGSRRHLLRCRDTRRYLGFAMVRPSVNYSQPRTGARST